MNFWYSVKGSVKCHYTDESRKVLDDLALALGYDWRDDVEFHEDGKFTLSLNHSKSYSSPVKPSDLDDKIKALGPFAVEVGYFYTVNDVAENQRLAIGVNDLWVGKPDEVEQAKRVGMMRTAWEQITKLERKEWETLRAVADKHFK